MQNLFFSIVAMDGDGIPHNIPNARYQKWKINSLGFRGEEMHFEKKEGQIRVVCFGASETLGFYESEGMEWPSQLSHMMKDQYPGVEIINVSVMGLRQRQRKAYIEKYVLPLKPDILVMNQHLMLDHIKVAVRGVEIPFVSRPVNVEIKNYSAGHLLVNRLLSDFRNKILYQLLPERLLSSYRMWKQRKMIRALEKKNLRNQKPLDQVPEEFILKYEQDLSSFIGFLKENNIVPVMVAYPSLITSANKESYKEILTNVRLTFIIEISENAVVDAMLELRNLIKRTAQRENVVCVDMYNLIPRTLDYYVDDFHYTDKGAEVYARHIYETLIQSFGLAEKTGNKRQEKNCQAI